MGISLARPPIASLPYSPKPVGGVIDYAAASGLSHRTPSIQQDWLWSVGWCTDASRYANVPCAEPITTRMSQADVDKTVSAGAARKLARGEQPRGWCNVFCVPEWHKNPPRRRKVAHPAEVNATLGRETLRKLSIGSRLSIRQGAFEGEHVVTVDGTSFFDQFPLTDDVGLNFCFRTQNGDTYCLSALPMGQRHSSEVATSLMRLLADFERPHVRIDIATDNVRFVGPYDAIIAAVTEFAARCDKVGVILNELGSAASSTEIAGLVSHSADFLGEITNYVDKTVTVRQKILDRIADVWTLRYSWNYRQFVGCMASLLWCAGPQRVDIAEHFASMSFLREAGRTLHFNVDAWDALVVVPDAVKLDLKDWVAVALRNEPHPILPLTAVPTAFLCTDASAWGWGAIFACNGTTLNAQMPWGASLADAHRSTTAEPEAIWRAVCKFLSPADNLTVCILTDHSGFAARYPKGFSASAAYNGVILRLHRRFPNVTFVLKHIPGKSNLADGLSRGPQPVAESGDKYGYQQVEGLANLSTP
jgi:hypothetical protein